VFAYVWCAWAVLVCVWVCGGVGVAGRFLR
jgi:hypothetical protein